jgi:hypothetical protein
MPDRLEKYPIDNKLIDDGWVQMSAMLDTAMPVTEKRRRVIPIWWWRTGIAAAVLLTATTLWHRNNSSNTQATHQVQNSSTTTPSVADNSFIKQAEIATTKEQFSTPNQLTTPIDKKNTPIKKANINATNSISKASTKVAHSTAKQKIILPISENKNTAQVTDNEIVKTNKSEIKANEIGISTSEKHSHFELLSALMGLKIQPIEKLTLASPAFAKILIKHKLPRPYQHGFFARVNYGGLIHNGYTYGYILRKNIAGKHNVQARLYVEKNTNFVHTVTENYTLSKDLLKGMNTSIPTITSDTTISRIIYPFTENSDIIVLARQNSIQATTNEDVNQYILLNSKHLGASMNYGYQISPRVELTLGLGFSRTIENIQYGFEIGGSTESNGKVSTVTHFDLLNTPSNKDQVTTLFDNQKIFNRWDGYYEWGMNYKVTPRFSIGGLLRRGIIDITKNDALGKKEYNNFLVMQGIYYFRK